MTSDRHTDLLKTGPDTRLRTGLRGESSATASHEPGAMPVREDRSNTKVHRDRTMASPSPPGCAACPTASCNSEPRPTVAGMSANSANNSRTRGSNGVNDVDTAGVRSYFGGDVEFTAFVTVLREIPNRSASRVFGTPSAANLRINAQSSKVITLQVSSAHFSPGGTAQFSAFIDRQNADERPPAPTVVGAQRTRRSRDSTPPPPVQRPW